MEFAVTDDGRPIFPEAFDEDAWRTLKASYRLGDYRTPCCSTIAIPKTSVNGVRFFAHQSDECTTSPESVWHVSAKAGIIKELAALGVQALTEKRVNGAPGELIADVYFEAVGRTFAIEVQHSYQTLAEYRRRQGKYRAHGIANYWLLYGPRYLTILKSIARLRLRDEYGGVLPPGGFFPCIPDLPLVFGDIVAMGGRVRGAAGLDSSLSHWLKAIVSDSFKFVDGAWRILENPEARTSLSPRHCVA
jgi:hypothetical protein